MYKTKVYLTTDGYLFTVKMGTKRIVVEIGNKVYNHVGGVVSRFLVENNVLKNCEYLGEL